MENIFREIQNCNICNDVENGKVLRNINFINTKAKVMLIAEALAEKQLRRSGVSYFDENGNISATGKMLEKFLNKIGQTIYPGFPNSIYSTEIVHCFPGHEIKGNKKSIKRPSSGCIKQCIGKRFLELELGIIKPKLIILMGKTSYEVFYEFLLCKKTDKQLTEKITEISKGSEPDKFRGIPIFPLQHASGANPRYSKMLENIQLIDKTNLTIGTL